MELDGKQVFEIINQIAADEEDRDEITLVPLMCGTGKSTAISYKIRQTIEEAEETGNGLLVVTDRKDRMNDYIFLQHPGDTNPPRDQELADFLIKNLDQVTLMTHENIEDACKTQFYKPVLMMTTQRFFRLSIEEINRFLLWKKGKRPLILIDERPELKTIVVLDGRKLAECEEAIGNSFEKDRCVSLEVQKTIEQFRGFIHDLNISDKCKQHGNLYFFWSWYDELMLEFKNIFDVYFEEITKNKNTINGFGGGEYYEDIFTRIRAIRMMENEKALFSHKMNMNNRLYTDKLCMILDNYSLVKNTNAKVIILDGTAELSPEYSIDSYKSFKDIPDPQRSLDKLTIKIIDIPTAKNRLSDKKHRKMLLDCAKLYWEEKIAPSVNNNKQWAIFSYIKLQNDLEKIFGKGRIEHFGNIKGKNDFHEAKHIMQIGLNRFPDEIYYLFYLAHHPEMASQFENANNAYKCFEVNCADLNESIITRDGEELEGITFPPDATETIEEFDDERIIAQSGIIEEQMKEYIGETRKIMNNMLLAEIEQNLFRGIIRHSDSEEEYTFHLFINKKAYGDLIDQMKKRYKDKLGAHIDDEELPIGTAIDKIMNRDDTTYPKKLIEWHDEQLRDGDEYTPAMIRKALGMQGEKAIKQYERMLDKCRVLRILLQAERKKEKDKEVKGYYIKRSNWHNTPKNLYNVI